MKRGDNYLEKIMLSGSLFLFHFSEMTKFRSQPKCRSSFLHRAQAFQVRHLATCHHLTKSRQHLQVNEVFLVHLMLHYFQASNVFLCL